MKTFSFRLDRVLQLRIRAEQEQGKRLAEAQQAETERRLISEAAAARVAEAIEQLSSTATDLRTAGTLSNLMLTLEAARARSEAAAASHREAVLRAEAERASFDAARQARRAIERLREQRHEAWEQEVGRVEQQALDEVALRMQQSQAAG